jgi:hypothetical protein
MNELSIEPVASAARARRSADADEPGTRPSAADVERGVNLLLLAAASFLRSAAAERDKGRGRPKRSPNARKSPPRPSAKPQ